MIWCQKIYVSKYFPISFWQRSIAEEPILLLLKRTRFLLSIKCAYKCLKGAKSDKPIRVTNRYDMCITKLLICSFKIKTFGCHDSKSFTAFLRLFLTLLAVRIQYVSRSFRRFLWVLFRSWQVKVESLNVSIKIHT